MLAGAFLSTVTLVGAQGQAQSPPNASVRERFFDSVLAMYTYGFGYSILGATASPHTQFVRSVYANGNLFKSLSDRTFLATTEKNVVARESILQSLVFRHPVYAGQPAVHAYDTDAVQDALGFNPSLDLPTGKLDSVRYVLAGPVMVNPTHDPVAAKFGHLSVVHVWGMNFENQHTHDFVKHVHAHRTKVGADTLFMCGCYTELRETLHLALQAAKRLKAKTVRVPGLGLGEFSKQLSVPQERIMKLLIIFVLQQFQSMDEYKGMHIDYRYPFDHNVPESNLFQSITSDHTCLVNAWDPRSFIGNGGCRDRAIDGFMVCGGESCGNNTAYLHNPFFNSASVLDSSRWLVLPSLALSPTLAQDLGSIVPVAKSAPFCVLVFERDGALTAVAREMDFTTELLHEFVEHQKRGASCSLFKVKLSPAPAQVTVVEHRGQKCQFTRHMSIFGNKKQREIYRQHADFVQKNIVRSDAAGIAAGGQSEATPAAADGTAAAVAEGTAGGK